MGVLFEAVTVSPLSWESTPLTPVILALPPQPLTGVLSVITLSGLGILALLYRWPGRRRDAFLLGAIGLCIGLGVGLRALTQSTEPGFFHKPPILMAYPLPHLFQPQPFPLAPLQQDSLTLCGHADWPELTAPPHPTRTPRTDLLGHPLSPPTPLTQIARPSQNELLHTLRFQPWESLQASDFKRLYAQQMPQVATWNQLPYDQALAGIHCLASTPPRLLAEISLAEGLLRLGQHEGATLFLRKVLSYPPVWSQRYAQQRLKELKAWQNKHPGFVIPPDWQVLRQPTPDQLCVRSSAYRSWDVFPERKRYGLLLGFGLSGLLLSLLLGWGMLLLLLLRQQQSSG
ncbi:MAG: hypothetical protein ACO1RX_02305 [Candidatus Sericytochromatia bacterium]